jgi:hypothetical protein
MKRAATLVCVVVLAGIANADGKADPMGIWKYTADVNGQSIDVTIKLKLDGDKLTGTVSVTDSETKIEDGKFKDGEVSFTVNPEFARNEIPGCLLLVWNDVGDNSDTDDVPQSFS